MRPESISEFTGQAALVENLKLFIAAAKDRGEALDHVLFHGPPGLGKTTLSQIVASEMGGTLTRTSAPVIENQRQLVSLFCSIGKGDVVFIDEIHRLPAAIEEILYTIMEDRRIDVIVGEGMEARSVSIELEPFTLVGATTRAGGLSRPLLDRFPIVQRLDYYSIEEMMPIVATSAGREGLDLGDGLEFLADRCRGTPRVANRMVARVRDFALVHEGMPISDLLALAMDRMGIGPLGLDSEDVRYMSYLRAMDRPVGLSTIAAAISETQESIEDVIEPFLLRRGLLSRTQRGRVLTEAGVEYLDRLDGSEHRSRKQDADPVGLAHALPA